MKRFLLIPLTVFSISLLFSPSAHALSCLPPNLEDSFESSDAVFIGEVVSASVLDNDQSDSNRTVPEPVPLEEDSSAEADIGTPVPPEEVELIAPHEQNEYDIAVLDVYKGTVDSLQTVYTDATWGPFFTVGDEVVIFAENQIGTRPGQLTVSLCGPTFNINEFYIEGELLGAQEVRAQLEELAKTTGANGVIEEPNTDGRTSDDDRGQIEFPLGIVIASLAAATMLLVIIITVMKSDE